MTNIVNNASTTEYWITVKQRAAIRKGLGLVKSGAAKLPRRTHYKAYLDDRCDLINEVSTTMGFNADPTLSDEFRGVCADALGCEELKATKVAEFEGTDWLPF